MLSYTEEYQQYKHKMKTDNPTIVLTGGWGYGNMGDDAILRASIHLIKDTFPSSEIRILTNDVEESRSVVPESTNISFYKSAQEVLFGEYRRYFISNSYKSIIEHEVRSVLERRNGERRAKRYFKNIDKMLKENHESISHMEQIMDGADLFIMSGGGFINDWSESLATKYIECLFAKRHGLRMFMIGQTIGPFQYPSTAKIGRLICSMMDGLFFRDNESVKDCQVTQNVIPHSVPDLALYDKVENPNKNKSLVFIPFRQDVLDRLDFYTSNLKKIAKDNNLEVIVSISQQWQHAINLSVACYLYFKNHGLDAKIVIPSNVEELQELVSSAELLISQNLHGLIMGYRSNVRILSINNARKFIGFMDLVSQNKYICDPTKADNLELADLADELLRKQPAHYSESLHDSIKIAFDNILKEA